METRTVLAVDDNDDRVSAPEPAAFHGCVEIAHE